ncbi:eukaryotic translation initiation factor 3 subunit A [Coccinella septempunctata]|uniref:eukaryotic translation initiation factor 3 subunit A n=1 Tax=Coccinella septempunctata TaxID=41139 RepID=UPI001D05FC3E|nr:eukaryotic translation initiation factor 3 subunit A [Coccinella septempunctata]
MARYGQRPENALKRANEFIGVGKPARALDTLQEVFRNKKWAYNWSESVLEPIMFRYLELCVDLKKSHIAKEGLFQYRNLFQSVNVGSLENVIRGYLRMAEERTENAREQSAQAVIDIDDLDNLATPESILLSAVSGEDAQDRSDRTILTPWVKFLWESYCQCLELLRTNAHVENLYHDIARMAFQFCLKYNRKTEFRKLCDKLRKHLDDICKLPTQVSNVSISKPETQQLNLETRLHQLDYAIQMELWQEAYKAIEDIHNLMNISKKMPVPKTMANYYQKLAMVFWKAGNYLFHAAALIKLFQLSKEMKKNITPEELQRMACRVLLATLSIPLPSAHPEFDRFIETDKSPLEKAQKLGVLLGLFQPPTRASLLKDLVRVNVVALATTQLQDLYNWLEVEFHPLLLCTRVQTVIKSISQEENTQLQQYIQPLQDVTLVRLVRQVAQVYQTIEFDRLIELSKFSNAFHMERLLVNCVRYNDMQIRIDHGKRCVHFGIDLSESQREEKPEGPTLQVMPSEQIRNQLVNMSIVLHQAMGVINPERKKSERDHMRSIMVQNYHENKVRQHQKILQRHKIIEDRKEYIERLNTVREEEEQRRLEEIQRQNQLAEKKRLELEREEREKKRAMNEYQQIKDRHLKEKLMQISQTGHGQKMLKKMDEEDIKKLDADQIAAKEAEELQKERRELQAKLKSQEKKVDYFERAKRLEEIPLLLASIKEKQHQDQSFWQQQEKERVALAIEERKLAVETRDRLARMKPDKDAFLEKLKKERNIVYEDKLKEFETMLAQERKKRLQKRKVERKEDRRIQWLKEKEKYEQKKREEQRRKEEEERQRLEELARKEQEEREKLEKAEKTRKKKEMEEMLERTAAKQRAREEEIERKLRADREQLSQQVKETTETSSSWRRGDPKPASTDSGVYRPKFTRSEDAPSRSSEAPSSGWRNQRGPPPKRLDDGRSEPKREERPRRDFRRTDDKEEGGRGSFRRSDDTKEEGGRGGFRRPEDGRDEGSRSGGFRRTDENREDGGGRGGFRRTEDSREEGGRGGGGVWRTGPPDRRREDREPRDRDFRDRDEGPKDASSWRHNRRTDDDQAAPSAYRPLGRSMNRDRDGPRNNGGDAPPKERDNSDWRNGRKAGGGDDQTKRSGPEEKEAPPKEKAREQPEKTQEDADGWSRVQKRR